MNRGCFVVIDGVNGAGKGTVIKALEEHLVAAGHDVLMTREPGGTPIGERIREILLDRSAAEMNSVTELLLFAAARAQHVREKIVPAIKDGKVVVSDRFDSATISFQHFGRGLPLDLIKQLNEIAVDGLKPDVTVVLDLDPVVGLERVVSRGDQLDRLEKENFEFLQRTRQGYLQQAELDPARFAIIDSSQSREKVSDDVFKIVDHVISSKHR